MYCPKETINIIKTNVDFDTLLISYFVVASTGPVLRKGVTLGVASNEKKNLMKIG
jgi:hypothetical protein